MNPTITIAPYENGFAVSVPGSAIALKSEAIAAAKLVKQVTNAEEQNHAIAVVAKIKGLTSGIERTRVEVKAPYWAACTAIDAKAKEFCADLSTSAKGIENLISQFQQRERAAAEAERIRQEKAKAEAEDAVNRERIRVEQAAKEAAEAEQRRVDAAAAAAAATGAAAKRKAAAAVEEATRQAAAAAQAALQAEIDAAEAEETASEASAIIYTPAPAKAHGAAVREVLEFEVTDPDAFAAWDIQRRAGKGALRSFIKIEVRRQDFGDYIKVVPQTALDEIPGVKIVRSTKAAVRAAAPETAENFAYSLPQ